MKSLYKFATCNNCGKEKRIEEMTEIYNQYFCQNCNILTTENLVACYKCLKIVHASDCLYRPKTKRYECKACFLPDYKSKIEIFKRNKSTFEN